MLSFFKRFFIKSGQPRPIYQPSRSRTLGYALAKLAILSAIVSILYTSNNLDSDPVEVVDSKPAKAEPAAPVVSGELETEPCDVMTISDLNYKAELLHRTGKAVKAVAAYRKLLKRDPVLYYFRTPRTEFWKHYAADLIAIGMTDDAKKALERLDERDTDPEILDMRGQIALALGDRDDARRLWNLSAKLDPKRAFPWLQLALIDLQGHELTLAKTNLDKAGGLEPNSLRVLLARARLHRLQGDAPETRNDERHLQELRKALPIPKGGMGSSDD